MKKSPSPLQIAVSCRLAALQAELGLNDKQMGARIGHSRTTWNNWICEGNMPDPAALVRLCEEEFLTMDWFYRGLTGQVPLDRAIRLEARLRGIDPNEITAASLLVPAKAEEMAVARRARGPRRKKGPSSRLLLVD